MKIIKSFFLLSLTIILLVSCEATHRFKIAAKEKATLAEEFGINVSEKNNKPIEKAIFFVNGKEIPSTNLQASIKTNDYGVGKHLISAMVYYGENKSKRVNSSFEVLAKNPPEVYDYKIINSYPHDESAYTQGLEYYNGFLYETTGKNGQSSLRKVELKSGKVLQKVNLDERYFGEGMTIFNGKIYFLTWKSNKGFVYSLDTFELEKEFNYKKSKEGWGLTHNQSELIKSDGTHKIWFLDPETGKEKRSVQVYTNKRSVGDLNELEVVNGKLYANKWQQNVIVIIDPKTGVVEGIADLTSLKNQVEKTQNLDPDDDVLNGIAYDVSTNRLFVTGKNWNTLFEIELIKK